MFRADHGSLFAWLLLVFSSHNRKGGVWNIRNIPVVFSNWGFFRKLFSFHFLLLLLGAGVAIHHPVCKRQSSEGGRHYTLHTTATVEMTEQRSMWWHMLSSRPYWGKTGFSIHLACFAKQQRYCSLFFFGQTTVKCEAAHLKLIQRFCDVSCKRALLWWSG